jgi:NADH dehydrogenase
MAARTVDVAIFGGGGFIGRHLLRALLQSARPDETRQLRIRVVTRDAARAQLAISSSSDPILQQAMQLKQVTFIGADVTRYEQVQQALQPLPHSVTNLVGILYETPPDHTFERVHVKGAENIARALQENEQHRRDTAAVSEQPIMTQVSAIGADFTATYSAYARTKGLAEQTLLSQLGKRVLILRPSIVFGPGDQFFTRFRDMARFSPILPLIGTGMTRFQPVHVEDLALAIARCTLPEERRQYGTGGPSTASSMDAEREQIYELGGRDILAFRELMERMLTATRMRRLLLPIPLPMASIQAQMAEMLHRMVPAIPPVLTQDQLALLERDNVVQPGYRGLGDLGITQPKGVDAQSLAYLCERR